MYKKLPLKIRLCSPRGFCAGVERAIQIVISVLKKYGSKIYVRHEIVHNKYVIEELSSRGVIFIEELNEIPEYDFHRPVIFSAHGISRSVLQEVKNRKIFYFDATCPLVSKVQKQALLHHHKGRHVILIGHANHPEVIGTMGQFYDQKCISLIETIDDAYSYNPNNIENLGFVTQTTLSIYDTYDIIQVLKSRFPLIQGPTVESICYATTNRQRSVQKAAPGSDLFLIIGAHNSSNSLRLVEVARKSGSRYSLLIETVNDINWEKLKDINIISISAGASAPEILVSQVIDAFRLRYKISIDLFEISQENETFPVNRELRDVALNDKDIKFLISKFHYYNNYN